MSKIKHVACITDHDVVMRMVEDNLEIDLMRDAGYPVVSRVGWWSDPHNGGTGECHVVPLFSSDKLEDVVNRFYDCYPKAFQQVMDDVAAVNQTLYDGTGMSKLRMMMAVGKLPSGLLKMLDLWAGGDFLEPGCVRKNLKRFFAYIPKLKVGVPYGKTRISMSHND